MLIAALEAHLEMSAARRGEDDPRVVEAYNRVAAAFETYDDALLNAFGEVTPLEVYDEDDDRDDGDDDGDDDRDDGQDDDRDDDEDDDDDDGQPYLGLDVEEYDLETEPVRQARPESSSTPGADAGRPGERV